MHTSECSLTMNSTHCFDTLGDAFVKADELDILQSITTPLNLPRFKDLRDKYETCLNQIKTFILQVDQLRGKRLDQNLQRTITEIKEAINTLKSKEVRLGQDLHMLAYKKSNIHHTLPMPSKYGKIDNPSEEGHMRDYDSVPKFVPNNPNSRFQLTWNNLTRAAGAKLSEDGYKQIVGCKLYGESASYFNLYKDRPLEELINILANRFCIDKPADQYIRDIEDYRRPKGQSILQTFAEIKFLINSA